MDVAEAKISWLLSLVWVKHWILHFPQYNSCFRFLELFQTWHPQFSMQGLLLYICRLQAEVTQVMSLESFLSDSTKFGQVFSGCIVLTVTSKLIILCKIGGVMRNNAEINYSGITVLQCSWNSYFAGFVRWFVIRSDFCFFFSDYAVFFLIRFREWSMCTLKTSSIEM